MEKASTPRNRLTRSSAKQVNTPKNVEQEESAEKGPNEEVKHSVRKTRRRIDSKTRTNGDTANIENIISNEDTTEDNTADKCQQEDLNLNNKSQDSPKTTPKQIPSPIISRRSLRARRSSTPGPELESSASKKMKRSSSSGKIDVVSTPTNRRGRRATSESKDFVFTPSKDKQSGAHELHSKFIPNTTLRTIEKIEEVNEGEKSSEDEKETFSQKANYLNNAGSKSEVKISESFEKGNLVDQLEVRKTDISVEGTELSTQSETNVDVNVTLNDSSCQKIDNSETKVNDNVILNDSSCKKIDNGVEIIDIAQKDTGLSNIDIVEESKTGEVNPDTEIEDGEPKNEPGLLSLEVATKPFSECNPSLEIGSSAKETPISNKFQSDDVVTELLCKSEDETIQRSAVNEIIENSDCEIENSIETAEISHNNTVKTNDALEVKNIEVDLDDDTEPEVSLKQSDEPLQSIMNEGTEEPESESNISNIKNDCKRNLEVQNEIENLEISKIDLINSSDSEDGIIEGQPVIAMVMNCEDDVIQTEDEKIITPGVETKCNNESLKECVEVDENLSGMVSGKDPQMIDFEMSDDHDHEKADKVTKEDSNCNAMEHITNTTNNMDSVSNQSRIELIDDDFSNKKLDIPRNSVDTELSKPFDITSENPHSIAIEDFPGSDAQDNNFQDPLLQDQCPNLDEGHNQSLLKVEEVNDKACIRLNDQVTNQYQIDQSGKDSQSVENYDEDNYNEENFDENYEDEDLNKSEDEGSCDIYKGLSDSGSYVDEKVEDSQFGESLSSELHSGSNESEEEYVSSVDDEENVEEKSELLNELCSVPVNLKAKELILSKDGGKPNEKNPDSPMTYDKALAIINKNRVKKIDDEEFFDMFTEELNRVSEKSGSDSDIAIVDEYLMEPEEPAKKNQPKTGNAQNIKQPPRPNGPVLSNQPTQHENFAGDFNQPIHAQHGNAINQHGHPIPTQHSHPAMHRVNYTQGTLYQQFDQNMHLRGQLMYNQYAHPSSSMQDPNVFNPPLARPDVNFSSGMFNHPRPLCPVSQSFPPNETFLKIRSVADMNNSQSLAHKNYGSNADQDERISERQEGKDNRLNMGSTSVSDIHNIDNVSARTNNLDSAIYPEFTDKKVDKSRTPILDLLGLDKQSLKLLKKALGLNSIKRELMKQDLELKKRYLEQSILKSGLRKHGRKRETRYRNLQRIRESDSSSFKSSSEHSSGESSQASNSFSKGRSSASSSENENREINVEDNRIYVTLKAKNKTRYQNEKDLFRLKKTCHSGPESFKTRKQKNKTKWERKSRISAAELNPKQMAQKEPIVVKSQCGTFTVDPLTASSQSSDSDFPSFVDKLQVKDLKRKMKRDLAKGKNKLSNMFTQHSFKKSKELREKTSEPFQEIKGPLRKEDIKELKKLPSEILETLLKEDKKKKRLRTEESGSDDQLERPKKIRKKSKKMKFKSKAGDQNYIPCVTGGTTQFGLSRLDKDGTLTLAEKAAKFRTDQLYGASVKRITILDFKHQWC